MWFLKSRLIHKTGILVLAVVIVVLSTSIADQKLHFLSKLNSLPGQVAGVLIQNTPPDKFVTGIGGVSIVDAQSTTPYQNVDGDVAISGKVSVVATNNAESPSIPKVITASDPSAPTKTISIGYDTAADAGVLASVYTSIGWRNTLINPNGGSVGIGTASPKATTHVYKGSSGAYPTFAIAPSLILEHNDFDGQLQFLAPDTKASYITFGTPTAYNRGVITYDHRTASEALAFTTATTEKMRITGGGNVGIGTVTPTAKLDVNGQIRSQDLGIVYQNDECRTNPGVTSQLAADVRVTYPTHSYYHTGSYGTYIVSWNNRAGSSSYLLAASKQYGGTMTVTMTRLGGNLDAGFEYVTRTVDNTVILLKQYMTDVTHQYNNASFTATLVEGGYDYPRGTTFACEDRPSTGWTLPPLPYNYLGSGNVGIGGNLGIGTVSPYEKLEVNGAIVATGGWNGPNAAPPGLYLNYQEDSGSLTSVDWGVAYKPLYLDGSTINFRTGSGSVTSKLTITAGGDVTTSQYLLVGQYLNIGSWTTDSPGTQVCKRSYDNYIGLCTSLRKYKENIDDLHLGIETVLDLKPRTFDWKQPPGSTTKYHDLGFIAEEVEQVNPLLAQYDDKGNLISVKYDKLTAVLTNAIQQQQKQLSSLLGIIDVVNKIGHFLRLETEQLIVSGVDIVEKLNTLSNKVDAQQKEINALKAEIKSLKQ